MCILHSPTIQRWCLQDFKLHIWWWISLSVQFLLLEYGIWPAFQFSSEELSLSITTTTLFCPFQALTLWQKLTSLVMQNHGKYSLTCYCFFIDDVGSTVRGRMISESEECNLCLWQSLKTMEKSNCILIPTNYTSCPNEYLKRK